MGERGEAAMLAALERQFAKPRCEAQHRGAICSGEVTHGFATCEGSRLLCLLGAAVKEAYLLQPEHLTCVGCRRPIIECWHLIELSAPTR